MGVLATLPMNVATYGETAQLIVGIRKSKRRSSAVTLITWSLGVRFVLATLWLIAVAATLGASP